MVNTATAEAPNDRPSGECHMLTKRSLGRRFGAVDRPQLAAQYCGQGTEDRATTYDWIVDVRSFFTDLCT